MMRVFLSILLLSSTLSFAQTFGEMGTVWKSKELGYLVAVGGNSYYSHGYRCYNYVDDVLVGNDSLQLINFYKADRSYHPVPGSYGAWLNVQHSDRYLKQDSNIVYYGDLSHLKAYYDFNLQIGDSLIKEIKFWGGNGLMYSTDTIHVVNVDSISIAGVNRKRITFDTIQFVTTNIPTIHWGQLPPMVWVEGIGDMNYGTFTFAIEDTITNAITYGPDFSLDCFVENDTSWIGNCDPFYACPWITTGVTDIHQEQFNIYPNPVQDLLQIDVLIDEEYAINVYDLNGRLVQWSESLLGNQILDVAGLKKGVYILEISKGESALTQRLVKL
jgi:hypothetical protein